MPKKGLNHSDRFRFVYENFTSKEQQRSITHDFKKKYVIYFVCPLHDRDKIRAPYKICRKCCLDWQNWLK